MNNVLQRTFLIKNIKYKIEVTIMDKQFLNEKLGRITPQQFGAVADGVHDDTEALFAAVREASAGGKVLELDGDYKLLKTLELADVEILSHNAKISFWGEEKSVPALDMKKNVNIFGTLHIWTCDNGPGNHGGRCAMGFGHYGTGAGGYNCYVEHVVITGGVENANGILITGDSNNIYLERVTIPAVGGGKIGRAVLLHWGNANDHYTIGQWSVENGYGHKENWKPSTHPHDVHIGLLECYNIAQGNFGEGALHIAAGYNVTVDELYVDGAMYAVNITGGDMGFEYANAEDKARGQSNIKIKKVTAKNLKGMALYQVGYALMYHDKRVGTELTIDEMYASAVAGNQAIAVVTHAVKDLHIKKLVIDNYKNKAIYIEKGNEYVQFDDVTVSNCPGYAFEMIQYRPILPQSKKVKIGSLTLNNCKSAANDALINIKHGDECEIDTLTVNDCSAKNMVALYNSFNRVALGTVNAKDMAVETLFGARETINEASSVTVEKLNIDREIPLTAGDCKVTVQG